MTEGITLSPREKEMLKLLASTRTLSIGFESKSRAELLSAIKDTELTTPMLNICQAFAKNKVFTDKELFLLNYFSASVKRVEGKVYFLLSTYPPYLPGTVSITYPASSRTFLYSGIFLGLVSRILASSAMPTMFRLYKISSI